MHQDINHPVVQAVSGLPFLPKSKLNATQLSRGFLCQRLPSCMLTSVWWVSFLLPKNSHILLSLTGLLGKGGRRVCCFLSVLAGSPALVLDRGSQFSFCLWPACSYHPLAKGIIKQLHRTLKNALCGHLSKFLSGVWVSQQPLVLLGLQTLLWDNIGLWPAD